MDPSRYLLPVPNINWSATLAEWDWLVSSGCTPICVTCFGDLFMTKGVIVHLLDLENATFDRYCDTDSDLLPTISRDEDADVLLYSKLVDQLRRAGINLDAERCYHFKTPTIIGGEFSIANVGTNTICERVRFCGDIQRQIKDLPDGTPIKLRLSGSS